MEVATVICHYQDHLQALGYATATVQSYRSNLEHFKGFLAEAEITDLRHVTRQTIAEYHDQVMAAACSIETKALKLRPVKRLFEYLVNNHRLLLNPTEGLIETCRKNKKLGPVLSIGEVQRLLAQPNLARRMQIRDRAIMEVLYSCGIRLGELLALTVHDVDFQDQVVFIRKGKGRKERVVPLGKTARQYVQGYLEKIRPRYARKTPGERTLFLKNTGQPLEPHNVRVALREYRLRAKIETPVSPHTLRRSCATHLVQQGADIRYIQQLLGHSRLTTTQSYVKVMAVEVKATHEKTHPGSTLCK